LAYLLFPGLTKFLNEVCGSRQVIATCWIQ